MTAFGYDVGVNVYEKALLVALLPLYFAALGLYHFMIFRVNQKAAASERIPHSLFWRRWSRVKDNYRSFYPGSSVYRLSLACSVAVAAIAIAFVALRIWEYGRHPLP